MVIYCVQELQAKVMGDLALKAKWYISMRQVRLTLFITRSIKYPLLERLQDMLFCLYQATAHSVNLNSLAC